VIEQSVSDDDCWWW